MIQAEHRARPAAWVAYKEANSHPEPMIELSDAQIAPTSPISRFSPTSAGRVTVAG